MSRIRLRAGAVLRGLIVVPLAAVLTLVSPSLAPAQQSFQQTVVVTAAARPVELGTVTRTITVIKRDQIDALPVRSIADVLRLASSIDVRARGVRGAQADFALRGATFGQVLVLVDGVRLNDAQSGHHNGDIPVPLDHVERIEILYGPGSSLFGADAVGGTVNIVTRRDSRNSAVLEGGSFGLVAAAVQGRASRGAIQQLGSASFERSDGFMYDRDFKTAILRSATSIGSHSNLSMSYQWKEFGANNFYGGNAPSREWTNQTLIAADHRFGQAGAWSIDARASYRTHGDRFLFNQQQPALSDNRHRTHAVLASASGSRAVSAAATATIGIESGAEWIRSTNLGDHDLARVSAFGEWRHDVGLRVQLDALVRVDRYNEFGTSWNPSFGAGWWMTPSVRFRGSIARAFRVPTFTERYYSDPANLAREDIGPERALALEGGADVMLRGGWLLQTTMFGRDDTDVIDWLRPTAADRWQTYNVRDVATLGFEVGVRKSLTSGAFVQAQYTAIDVDATAVTQLSKYVLDYAPHSFTAVAAVPLPAGFRVAPRAEYRRRSRTTGTSDYVLFDARLGRRINRTFDVFVDGTNLFDVSYQEIAGVAMPGAAVSVSLGISAR